MAHAAIVAPGVRGVPRTCELLSPRKVAYDYPVVTIAAKPTLVGVKICGAMRILRLVVVLLGLMNASHLSAETLQEAWAQAATHDQSLAAASADAETAQANERAARGARWPSLDANAGYNRLNVSPTLDVTSPHGSAFESGPIFKGNQYVWGTVQMKVPLYTGGQITAGISAARSVARGAGEIERVTASTLKLEVAESYVAVLRARRALKAAASGVESLAAHVRDVEVMVNGDLVPRSDLLAARVALAAAEQARLRAANAIDLALATYNRRLGQPLDRSPELEEHLPADVDLSGQAIETLIAHALETRGELGATSAQADALAAQARAEGGKLLPQLALIGSFTHFDNQILDRQDFSMIGVGVTWNLFDGGQARNRAAALRSASRAQQDRLDDLRSRIALELRQGWLGVKEAQASLRASAEAVSQADENLRMSRELYGAGLATNTQVLAAVTLQIDAVNNRDNALLDESLSRLRLARAAGEL